MKKAIVASLLASVAVFVWGFVFWGMIEPSVGAMDRVPDEEALGALLKDHLPAEGTYMMPLPPPDVAMDDPAMETWNRRHLAGPIVTIMFQPGGKEPMAPSVFVLGFLHVFASVMLMAFLLRWVSRSLATFGQRWCLVFWIGAIEAVWTNVGRPIWFFQPWDYHLLQGVYSLASWAIVGLILAWFVHGDT